MESEGKIKSIYYENANPERCNWDSCLYFDNKKFDFIEKNFSDEFHSGLYKVFIKPKEKGKEEAKCLQHNPVAYGLVDKCFYLEKINKVSSIYSKKSEYRKDGFTIKMFKKEEMVFEYHGQFYSTKAVGAFGGGICEVKSDNQNFNVFSIGQ